MPGGSGLKECHRPRPIRLSRTTSTMNLRIMVGSFHRMGMGAGSVLLHHHPVGEKPEQLAGLRRWLNGTQQGVCVQAFGLKIRVLDFQVGFHDLFVEFRMKLNAPGILANPEGLMGFKAGTAQKHSARWQLYY